MEAINNLYENYGIKVDKKVQLSNKTYKIVCDNTNCYFIKQVPKELENKYIFLSNHGINNIIYPYKNNNKEFISSYNSNNYYISDYITNNPIGEDQIGFRMFYALDSLHNNTSIKRQLSVNDTKPKFEEITKQLDYKFKLIESYIRSLETKPINKYSYLVLENYHILILAKSELINLQKKIIASIKAKESVEYVFLHNNPKLEHLLIDKGNSYLTSIDNSKIGIDSLDLAKFYVENQYLKLDFKKIIFDDYYSHKQSFYYDYFCFMVLFIYIKRINFTNMSIFNIEKFVHNCENINNFIETFLNKEQN